MSDITDAIPAPPGWFVTLAYSDLHCIDWRYKTAPIAAFTTDGCAIVPDIVDEFGERLLSRMVIANHGLIWCTNGYTEDEACNKAKWLALRNLQMEEDRGEWDTTSKTVPEK